MFLSYDALERTAANIGKARRVRVSGSPVV